MRTSACFALSRAAAGRIRRPGLARRRDRRLRCRNDRGWLLIEAEAGLGKTAFIAWVARERRYVHHFVRLMPNADDVGAALRSLAAQLIRAWDLQHLAVGGVLPPNASRPDFFADLLFEAAARRDAVRPGEPIVIAVDGLHETVAPAGQNPLGLPADLPTGVYLVATQRTSYVRLTVVSPPRGADPCGRCREPH